MKSLKQENYSDLTGEAFAAKADYMRKNKRKTIIQTFLENNRGAKQRSKTPRNEEKKNGK